MADNEHLKILEKGIKTWNNWREKNPKIVPELSGAYLNEANLVEANLSRANLTGSLLFKANLSNADLRRASLLNVNLIGASLSSARIDNVRLKGATLSYANLAGAHFINSDLSHADLKKTFLFDTIFGNTSLANTKHLESCIHYGPSFIDHLTLSKSGKLLIEFMRGCGLPDFIIDNINVINGSGIEFYSCFISHSVKDNEFAERLHADLQNKGVRCWFAPQDMEGGKKLHHQIDEAIRIHDKLLLILSEESMKSDWVATEIKKAIKREKKEGKQMLFPISITSYENNIKQWELFDSDSGRDLAEVIRSYFIPDFNEWKIHESYQKVFKKLVETLKGIKKSVDIKSEQSMNA